MILHSHMPLMQTSREFLLCFISSHNTIPVQCRLWEDFTEMRIRGWAITNAKQKHQTPINLAIPRLLFVDRLTGAGAVADSESTCAQPPPPSSHTYAKISGKYQILSRPFISDFLLNKTTEWAQHDGTMGQNLSAFATRVYFSEHLLLVPWIE